MLDIQWPWLALLLPLPLLVRLLSKPLGEAANNALRVPFFHELQQLSSGNIALTPKTNRPQLLLMWGVWLCLIAAACRPHWIGEPVALSTSGRDLMLAVDISGSMEQEDMMIGDRALPRITVVKAVVNEFIRQRQGDKLGLILFGSQAYIQSPLSFDLETVKTLMDEAQAGFAGKQTAIGDAIGFAVKRLRNTKNDSRVLVLLSDGADNASSLSPLQAAKIAASEQVKIYTIGVGATEMRVAGIFGSNFGARTMNPSADLDEEVLTAIAEATGGQFFRARNPAELQAAYRSIAALEPIEQERELLRPQRSLLHWPLLLATLLMALLAVLRSDFKIGGKRHDAAI